VIRVIRHLLAPTSAGLVLLAALAVPVALGAQGGGAAAGGPVAATSATGATGSTAPAGSAPLVATLTACHSDPLAANRYAIFASQMTAIAGSSTMAVDFQLQERAANAVSFVAVAAPGFGVWVSSQPGVGIYTYDHEVTALPAPAAFRVIVRARWINRRHRVIRRGQVRSPVCVQPLTAPNLAVTTLKRSASGTPATLNYDVGVINAGTAAAGPFAVSLTVNGTALTTVTVPGLAPGGATDVQFQGPRCTAGTTLTATADASSVISEPANPARTKTFPCLR